MTAFGNGKICIAHEIITFCLKVRQGFEALFLFLTFGVLATLHTHHERSGVVCDLLILVFPIPSAMH